MQVAREEVFENFHAGGDGGPSTPSSARAGEQPFQQPPVTTMRSSCVVEAREEGSSCGDRRVGEPATEASGHEANARAASLGDDGVRGPITVVRHSRLAPYKPGKMTVVLDMDECLLHSKFHGPGAASEAYRQLEERPDAVNEVNSFWVALDDGDTAQASCLSKGSDTISRARTRR